MTLPHVEGLESQKPCSRHVRYCCPFMVVPTEQVYSATVEEPLVVMVTVPFIGDASDGHETVKYMTGNVSVVYQHAIN